MDKIINNLNLMSEEELLDPSISAEKLLNGHRAYYYDLFDPPFYILSRYNDIDKALRDPETFLEGYGNGPNFINSNGIVSDGDHHTFIRRIVQPNFLMGSIKNLERRLEEITDDLLDQKSPYEIGLKIEKDVIFRTIGRKSLLKKY